MLAKALPLLSGGRTPPPTPELRTGRESEHLLFSRPSMELEAFLGPEARRGRAWSSWDLTLGDRARRGVGRVNASRNRRVEESLTPVQSPIHLNPSKAMHSKTPCALKYQQWGGV